jgi:hypothetical protein
MEILPNQEEKPLFEIDEQRLEELIQICKQYYPTVSDYFIHSVCNEQCMVEPGYIIDEVKGEELYQIAKEELTKTEYNIKFQKNLSEQIISNTII